MKGEVGRNRNKNKLLLKVCCFLDTLILLVHLKGYIVRKTAEKRAKD